MSLVVLGGKAFGLISGSILGVKIEEEKQGKEKKKKKKLSVKNISSPS